MTGPAGPVVLTRAINCPGCGAAMTMRAEGHSLSIVCEHCFAVLDAKDEALTVMGKFASKMRFTPVIPLGLRGRLRGIEYETIGTQVRTTTSDGVSYSWSEYLLFNPYHGFRYLTHYQGHWNFVKTYRALPVASSAGAKAAVIAAGEKYTHFQTAHATTTFVAGEFPWQVHGRDQAEVRDYIAPPHMLSSEETQMEITWSQGEYISGQDVWQAFKVPGQPPVPVGVFADQPNPNGERAKGIWGAFGLLLLGLAVLWMLADVVSSKKEVFVQDYAFQKGKGEPSFVTEPFDLTGRTSNVEISTTTDIDNNWAYFNYALINDTTGKAYDFGREVSYYTDSEGSEGSRNDTAVIPSVPAGRYYLRVEPETPDSNYRLNYHLRVRRDVPMYSYPLLAFFLLLIPPIVVHWRVMAFEGHRWAESDYAPAPSSGDDSGGDD